MDCERTAAGNSRDEQSHRIGRAVKLPRRWDRELASGSRVFFMRIRWDRGPSGTGVSPARGIVRRRRRVGQSVDEPTPLQLASKHVVDNDPRLESLRGLAPAGYGRSFIVPFNKEFV